MGSEPRAVAQIGFLWKLAEVRLCEQRLWLSLKAPADRLCCGLRRMPQVKDLPAPIWAFCCGAGHVYPSIFLWQLLESVRGSDCSVLECNGIYPPSLGRCKSFL